MNKLKISIKGRRIESFIKRLMNANISLIDIEYISHNEINVLIYQKDYQKLRKLKTIYKIKIIKKYGVNALKEIIKKNTLILITLLIGIILLILLSNTIFSIKVIHNNEELRNLLYQELDEYGIKEHTLRKSKKEIERIKTEILKEYKDKLEWLEIERIGTSYIIRVEERIIPDINIDTTPRHVVAKKNAVIRNIEAKNGNVERQRGEYVTKGSVIISGEIKLNENIKDVIHADGTVYGEVWYTVDLEYPYVYQEEIKTDETSLSLDFIFLSKNKKIRGKNYKYQKVNEKFKITSNILPIYLSLNENTKINKIDYILTCDQASNKALEKGLKQINSHLKENEYIIESKILSSSCDVDRVNLKVFYTVMENITDYQKISYQEENLN